MTWLEYANQGATRNLPLSERLTSSLGFLPEMGLRMQVFSGGQPKKGSGKPRVGSVRHDHGDAADVFFYKGDQRLDWANPEHQPIFQDIVRKAKANGVTGFGAGPGYMQQGSMHIGFGTPAVWGAAGKGANAPDWLRAAYGQSPTGDHSGHQHATAPTGQATLLGGPAADTIQEAPMQPQPQQRGLLFDKLPQGAQDYLSPERVARMQMALEGMTLNPNQGVMMAAQETIKGASDSKKRNKTAEWLAKNGRPDLAECVAAGAIDGKAAIAAAMKKPDPTANFKVINGQLVDISTQQVVGDYRDAEKPPTSDDIREFEFARANDGYEGTFQDWLIDQRKAGASSVTVGDGLGAKPLGTQGDVLIADPEAPGGVRVIQAEGSKAARDVEAAADAAEVAKSNATTSTGIITTAAQRAREAARQRSVGGLAGQVAAANPGSENAEVYRQVEVLKSNAKIENLTAMRAASPTGGALGAVSDKESQMLASKAGALDPASPNFERDLDDYERTLLQVVHGADEGTRIFEQTRGGREPFDPQTPDFSAMSTEEIEAYIAENSK